MRKRTLNLQMPEAYLHLAAPVYIYSWHGSVHTHIHIATPSQPASRLSRVPPIPPPASRLPPATAPPPLATRSLLGVRAGTERAVVLRSRLRGDTATAPGGSTKECRAGATQASVLRLRACYAYHGYLTIAILTGATQASVLQLRAWRRPAGARLISSSGSNSRSRSGR